MNAAGATFAALIAPMPVARFMAEQWDARFCHIPAAPGRGGVMDWAGLSALLQLRSHWTPANIILVSESRPIEPHHYLRPAATLAGIEQRADPDLVAALLRTGASLVAHEVDAIAPAVAAIAAALGAQFAASVHANAYASFGGIQAFASHCDPHDVFALQCEGEKRWRIYANRADAPMGGQGGGSDEQARIDREKGAVVAEIVTRPGDILYLPRGVYHDALATSAASLHLSFGVLPAGGAILFEELRALAMADAAFRAYLPDARDAGALEGRLDMLAERLAAMIRSPALRHRLAARQRGQVPQTPSPQALPDMRPMTFYRPTGRPIRVDRDAGGTSVTDGRGRFAAGAAADALEWILAQPGFAREMLAARFAHHPAAELDAMIGWLERAQIIAGFAPARR